MKRFVCFLLALIMVLGMIPNTMITANAASNLKTSTKAVEVLLEKQGFQEKEYQVGDTWYIGYGSVIKKGDYPNGITKEKAVELVRNSLSTYDDAINAFTKKNNLDLMQYQHDALALFCYRTKNTGWMNGGNALYEAVRTGKTGTDFINTIAHTGNYDLGDFEGMAVVMNYRLSEANMYLNNTYAYYAPSNYGYVLLDEDGTEQGAESFVAFAGSYTLPLATKSGYEFLGWYKFDDKVDSKISGEPLTKVTSSNKGDLIVAKFCKDSNPVFADYKINTSSLPSRYIFDRFHGKETFNFDPWNVNDAIYKAVMEEWAMRDPDGSRYKLKSNSTFTVDKEVVVDGVKWLHGTAKTTYDDEKVTGWVYLGELVEEDEAEAKPIATATINATNGTDIYPGANSNDVEPIGHINKGVTVYIYEIKMQSTETGNKSWGKVNVNGVIGWINLVYADVDETTGDTDSVKGMTGKIANTENVNIRKGAGTNYAQITTLARGTKVTVLETVMNGEAQWGKIRWSKLSDGYTEGWVYMYYVELDDAAHSKPGDTEDEETILYTGIVTSNIDLNVRKKASVLSDKVGSLPNGTKINIYEVKTKNGVKWGRIGENRWVCLQYVNLTEVEHVEETPTVTVTSTQGTVSVATLDVMKNYNSNAEKVGTLKKGDVVTILEKNTEVTTTGSRIWGRISTKDVAGWINLAYVDLKTVTSVSGGSSSSSSGAVNSNGAAAVISNCVSVNIREGAGVANAQITKLNNGTAVKVYEQVTKDNAPWAKITWNNGANSGWVCMNYVTMSSGTVGSVTEGGLINGTNSNTISATGSVNSNIDLNVRSVAGLNGIKLGTLKNGTKVTIYEQVSADGMIWGRIPYGNGSGWVCMSYISIESATSTGKGVMGTIARCFAAVNVRSAPGTNNALINKINVGTRVEVFETKTYSNQLWGRVAQGWICMDYVLLDSELPEGTILDATVPTTEATTAPTTDVKKEGEVSFKIEATITPSANQSVNVYNDATSKSDRVGTIASALNVDIRALKNNGAELWGRIDQYGTAGWILMSDSTVNYWFDGYVNEFDAPVYVDASTNSTVKGSLPINEPMHFTKVTTDGTNVYGWVEKDIYGWIPMSKISSTQVDVLKEFQSGETVGTNGQIILEGKTFAAVNAYDVIGGSKILFKMKSGVNVKVTHVRFEGGKVWGCVEDSSFGTYGQAWFDLGSVNYTLLADTEVNEIRVRSSMNNSTTEDNSPNNIVGKVSGTVKICQLAFDSYGNLWARITGNTADAQLNGMYVMVRTAAQGVDGYEVKNYGKIFIGNHDEITWNHDFWGRPTWPSVNEGEVLPEGDIDSAETPDMT